MNEDIDLGESNSSSGVSTQSIRDSDDHWVDRESINLLEEAQPLIESETMTEKLKKTILGFEQSGRAISAALDRHREVPQADSQRRKSGDWQQLQISKGSGLYTSPGGKRFGRDDSDTRHYRRYVVLYFAWKRHLIYVLALF